MATTPEYGEELLVEERVEEDKESSRGPLPCCEEEVTAEVAEHQQAEDRARRPAGENHEAHRAGVVCEHCGEVIGPHDDARLTVDGLWVHQVCH